MSDILAPPHDEAEKLRWEIAKLRTEVHALSRAPYKNPSFLFTALTALAAIFGIGIQYVKSDQAYQLAEIKRQQVALDTVQLARKRFEADSLLREAIAQLQATSARRTLEERRLASAESALVIVRQALAGANGPPNQRAVAAVTNVTALVQAASRNTQVAAEETRSTIERVEQLRSAIQSPAPQSTPKPTAVVTGGFESIEEARRDASATRTAGYPASVYRRHNQYRTAIWFAGREAARAALPEIRDRVRRGAYMVDGSEWCLGMTQKDDYFVCQDGDPERVVY